MQNSLKKHLPYQKKYPKTSFLLKSPELEPLLPILLQAIETKDDASPKSNCVEIIKPDHRRRVLRIQCEDISLASSFIVKIFTFVTWRHRIGYYWKRYTQSRFGFGDAHALLTAKHRGVNTPDIYGYGCIKNLSVFPETDIVIMQDLNQQTYIGDMLSQATSDAQCQEILQRTIPILATLHQAGCNNIDLNTGAFMLGNTPEDDDYVLDFEYAQFHDKPSVEILMSEIGRFAQKANPGLSSDSVNWWLEEVLDTIGVTAPPQRKRWRERFDYYYATKLPRKTRMRIK